VRHQTAVPPLPKRAQDEEGDLNLAKHSNRVYHSVWGGFSKTSLVARNYTNQLFYVSLQQPLMLCHQIISELGFGVPEKSGELAQPLPSLDRGF